jgi:acetyl esterase/lipase
MTRVVSKNLFHFKLTGQMDDEVKEMEAESEETLKSSPEAKQKAERMKELELKHDPESDEEFVFAYRRAVEPFMESIDENEALSYVYEQAVHDHFKVRTTHTGLCEVPVEVSIPKTIKKEKKRAAYVYAHGGAAVAGSVNHSRSIARGISIDMNVVVFSVNYRVAPEAKCPTNIKDFYDVVKYISKNAKKLKIDPKKIVIGGESGGGYVCLGAMVLLAEHGETDMVKLAIPCVPMVDDYCFSDPLCMTVEERKSHLTMRKIWKDLVAEDYEKQKTSPYLFPGKASEEILEKFPPTIIMEVEFDLHITEATRLANRLRRVGRLLEYCVIPGATHISRHVPGTKGNSIMKESFKAIAREYIHS